MEAQAGAKIVFWSELNGAVLKQDEDMLLQRASDMAKQEEIYLIVSLLVKTPYVDLKENKTVAFNPQGELISEYFKHGRSIGELCQKGDGILKSFDTEYGRPNEYKDSLDPSLCGIIKLPVVVEGPQGTDIAYAGISFAKCGREKTTS